MDVALPLKFKDARTGETRRLPAPVRGAPRTLEAFVSRVAESFGLPDTLCLTYVDEQRDRVVVDPRSSSSRDEWREAHRCMAAAGAPCLAFEAHASKAAALAAAPPPPAPASANQGPLRLGPHPGRVVALDLKIPLKYARELVRRARRGDEIARRTVAPSAAFWTALKNSGREAELHRDELYVREVPPPPPAFDEHRHAGVICDGCDKRPIVGARYHLVGQDYDLCGACKAQDQTSRPFVRINAPKDARRVISEATEAAQAAQTAAVAAAAQASAAEADEADAALQAAVAMSLQDLSSMAAEDARAPDSDEESAVLVEKLVEDA